MIYDVAIAGLGPAGATAAFELSNRGFNVLAIEKAHLPRYKPCGGGLSPKIDRVLFSDFKSVVERDIHGLCLRFRGDEIHSRSESPICYMVMRDRFDFYLAESAINAGTRSKRERLMKVEEREGKGVLTTDKGQYYADMVIGADGAGSTVARSFGLKPKSIPASLVEGEVKIKTGTLEKVASEVYFDFGFIPHGYGWIFPKADHLSVGVGGINRSLKSPLPYYSEFLENSVPDITENYIVRRSILPVFNGRSRISSDNCLLVGDAAALVDPFLGEGIYYAIRSAQIAADVIAEGHEPAVFEKRISDEIYSEFGYAGKVGTLFYNFPGLIFNLLKHRPEFIKRFFELSRGDISYRELWERIKKIKELMR